MIDKLPKHFGIYFIDLINILYSPRSTFKKIFQNRSKNFQPALIFAIISVFISYSLLLIAIHLLNIDIKINNSWNSIISNIAIIPVQLTILVPILSAAMHLSAKLFKGKGSIRDSVVLVLYSYTLSPFASALLIIFLIIENIFGYPVSLRPPADPVLSAIEHFIEAIILIYGCYILARGVQFAHNVVFSRALLIVFALATSTVALGYTLSLLAFKFLLS